jgi:hypothetical protein
MIITFTRQAKSSAEFYLKIKIKIKPPIKKQRGDGGGDDERGKRAFTH